jgi:hypothetical protein
VDQLRATNEPTGRTWTVAAVDDCVPYAKMTPPHIGCVTPGLSLSPQARFKSIAIPAAFISFANFRRQPLPASYGT